MSRTLAGDYDGFWRHDGEREIAPGQHRSQDRLHAGRCFGNRNIAPVVYDDITVRETIGGLFLYHTENLLQGSIFKMDVNLLRLGMDSHTSQTEKQHQQTVLEFMVYLHLCTN